tara:strand:+ start:1522 stop:2052 length:531 start_codon:yes stop_codon:yes gene_type:complete
MIYRLSNKALIILLLIIIIFSLILWYLDTFSNKDNFFGRRRRRGRRWIGNIYRQHTGPTKYVMDSSDKRKMQQDLRSAKSQAEIARQSGTSQHKEFEKIKRNYRGNLTGAVYTPSQPYPSQPANIIPTIDSMKPFNQKRNEIKQSHKNIDKKWHDVDELYASTTKYLSNSINDIMK